MGFEEYDIVKSTQVITERIVAGTIGTIVIVHNVTPGVYEVEFVNAEGETIDIITVGDKMIKRVVS